LDYNGNSPIIEELFFFHDFINSVLMFIIRFVGFKFFSLPKMIRNGIPRFFLFRKWFRTEFRGFSHPKMVWDGTSKGFSLPRNGSEQNSEVFLFRETSGIPTELPTVPSCSVFHGIIFLSENGNPSLN
jgi:hypothetical protein